MRWIVAMLCLLAAPMASALPVTPGDVEFSLFRDEAQAVYVVTPDAAATYSVGFWGSAGNYLNTGREWAFVFTDLDGPFSLDPSGMIAVETLVGGGAQEAGRAQIGWELVVDGKVAVTGAAQTITYVEQKVRSTWSVRAPELEIDNGDSFRVFTTGHVGKGARMDLEPSKLVLPVLVGTPSQVSEVATTYENVTGVPIDRSFTNTTGTTWINWTLGSDGAIEAVWNMTSGSLHVQVLGSDNATLFDQVVNGTGVQVLAPMGAGAWRVMMAAQNATGSFGLRLAAASGPDGPSDGGDPDGTPGMDDDGNGTVDGDGPAKDSPLPVLVVVGALLVAARRRR